MEIQPLDAPFGLEIRGVDATRRPSPEVAVRLRKLVAEHCCLVLRDQRLTEEQHVAFVEGFGETVVPWLHAVELDTLSRIDELPGRPGYTGALPGVVYFVNGPRYRDEPTDGYLQGWHADMTHLQVSLPLVFLNAIEAPEHGYETWISNQYLAYESLRPEVRARIDELWIPHSFRHVFPNLHPVLHPVALKHPLSERRAVYGIPGSAEAVPIGVSAEEAAELETLLTAHLDDDRFLYKHRWRDGDILVWDNRCALHRRGPQSKGQTRVLRRVMAGDGHPDELRRFMMGHV